MENTDNPSNRRVRLIGTLFIILSTIIIGCETRALIADSPENTLAIFYQGFNKRNLSMIRSVMENDSYNRLLVDLEISQNQDLEDYFRIYGLKKINYKVLDRLDKDENSVILIALVDYKPISKEEESFLIENSDGVWKIIDSDDIYSLMMGDNFNFSNVDYCKVSFKKEGRINNCYFRITDKMLYEFSMNPSAGLDEKKYLDICELMSWETDGSLLPKESCYSDLFKQLYYPGLKSKIIKKDYCDKIIKEANEHYNIDYGERFYEHCYEIAIDS